jgi:hypothetical protein
MKKEDLLTLLQSLGQKYSEVLEVDLSDRLDIEVFKWFLVSLLFGAPITESAVIKTYKSFRKDAVLTPKRIIKTGWDGLVKILDEGGYTRYDFKTADKLLLVSQNLIERYDGSLNEIHRQSSDPRDLERRLKELGKGIGDVTVSIFLRELRGAWKKADPYPTPLTIAAAEQLGIVRKDACPEAALEQLKAFWQKNAIKDQSFVNFETALLRFEKDYVRKGKCFPFPSG